MNDYDNSFMKFFETAKIAGKLEVNTSFVVAVLSVSDDGKYVDVMHCNLEWSEDSASDTVMLNSFLEEIAASPTKPWVMHDVPVEKHEYGPFKIRVRPRKGDIGKMTVYYHDIASLKREGGFQAPDVINVHSLTSCTYHPMGQIGHPQNDADTDPYPAAGMMEITSGAAKIQITDDGHVNIITDANLTINNTGDATITATGNMTISAAEASITTTGDTKITASGNVDMSGSANVKIPAGSASFIQNMQTDSLGKPILTAEETQ